MKKSAILACSLALASLSCTPMFADTLFNFSFTGTSADGSPGTPFSGSGQFDAQATGTAGQYQVIGVTGTVDGFSIASLDGPGTYFGNDNVLYFTTGDSTATVDADGISYQLLNGPAENIFLDGSVDREVLDGIGNSTFFAGGEFAPLSITPASVSATPEPGTIALLGTSLLGMAGVLRRRFTA